MNNNTMSDDGCQRFRNTADTSIKRFSFFAVYIGVRREGFVTAGMGRKAEKCE